MSYINHRQHYYSLFNMVEHKPRKKTWMLERKMLVIALCVLICVPTTKGYDIGFVKSSTDNWQFLIVADARDIDYEFCKYNAASTGRQCTSFPKPSSVDFERVCNCTIQRDKTNEGSFFDLNCKSDLSYCPKELTITYRQGSYARAPYTDVATSGINGWLVVSIAVNVLLLITIILYLCNEKLHAFLNPKWNQLCSYSQRIYSRLLHREQESVIDSLESGLQNTSKKQNTEVDKNCNTKLKETPLQLASLKQKEVVTKQHTSSAQDSYKLNKLHYLVAQDKPDPEKIKTQLENGADVHARDEEGLTALHHAARFNQSAEIVNILIENDADVHSQTQRGSTALHQAARWNKSPEIVKILLKNGAKVNEQKNDKWTALHLAARYNPAPEIVLELLENGADVHSQSKDGHTALHLAAQSNSNPEIVKILFEKEAEVNGKARNEWTALHYAAKFSPVAEIVQMLLENGADVHLQDQKGLTALHLAARYTKNPEIVTILLEKSAKVNAQDNEERTALHYAAENNQNAEVVLKLLENGADALSQDRKGLTALHLARKNENPEIEPILLKAVPK